MNLYDSVLLTTSKKLFRTRPKHGCCLVLKHTNAPKMASNCCSIVLPKTLSQVK